MIIICIPILSQIIAIKLQFDKLSVDCQRVSHRFGQMFESKCLSWHSWGLCLTFSVDFQTSHDQLVARNVLNVAILRPRIWYFTRSLRVTLKTPPFIINADFSSPTKPTWTWKPHREQKPKLSAGERNSGLWAYFCLPSRHFLPGQTWRSNYEK